MSAFTPAVRIQVNSTIYIKDPETSALGQRIVAGSIELLCDVGFEAFTFRKLASYIGSTEASVYRYFESKYKLLLYLSAWYWRWMEYRLLFSLANVEDARDRLSRAINLLTAEVQEDGNFAHINEVKLHRLVVSESPKVYLTKSVDEENGAGVFRGYKDLVARVADVITELRPEYKYPHMLISTVVEGAHQQRFFAEHLPRLTDVVEGEDAITSFYRQLVFNAINIENTQQ